MSTKIYTGMRATDRNPFRVQRRIKAVLEPIFKAKFDKALEKAISKNGEPWDEVFPSLFPRTSLEVTRWHEAIPKSRYQTAEQLYELVVALQNTATHTFNDLDFGYTVILLPNGKGIAQEPLVLVFSEEGGTEYRRALIEAEVTEDYGYWNNTDQPDNVSDHEWAERKKAWDKLEVPNQDGLSIAMPSKFETAWQASDRGR